MDKKSLTETDIRTKFITPALLGANQDKWNLMTQIREEIFFTKGRVIVRGKTVKRGEAKKADYILYHKPNMPIAVVEAKDNNHSVGDGMQQALSYAEILDVPFAYSSNGDAFLEHDRTATGGTVTREIPLEEFPTPDELWSRYRKSKGYTPKQEAIATQDYYNDGSGKLPRYYQLTAINRTIDAIARGQNRILLVMATGTGKTYTAFQIIWRLWKSGAKKRILFLVDRNILADQTKTNDFKPFGSAMTKITNRTADKSFEIFLALYQAVTGTEDEQNIYKQFSPDFFDLIIIDECHRGSAADDAAWRQVLEYFSSATQIGLTATPRETKEISNIDYFGEPLAVQGKLVPQDPNDEPAEEILAGIAGDVAKAVRAKRMRNSRPIPAYEDEFPFDLPVGWAWAPLGTLTAAEDGAMCDGPFGSKLKTEHYIPTKGYAVLRLGNIGVGYFIHGKEGHISREHFESLPSNHTAPGDLLVAGLADPLVRCCEIPPDIGPAVNKSDCFRVRLSRRMERSYVRHYLNSPIAKAFAAEENHGMTRERINLANAKALPVPIPPLAEQRRIVAKVEQLMALVDALETQFAASRTTAANLLSALVAELTGTSNNGKVFVPSASATGRRGRPRKLA